MDYQEERIEKELVVWGTDPEKENRENPANIILLYEVNDYDHYLHCANRTTHYSEGGDEYYPEPHLWGVYTEYNDKIVKEGSLYDFWKYTFENYIAEEIEEYFLENEDFPNIYVSYVTERQD